MNWCCRRQGLTNLMTCTHKLNAFFNQCEQSSRKISIYIRLVNHRSNQSIKSDIYVDRCKSITVIPIGLMISKSDKNFVLERKSDPLNENCACLMRIFD